MVPGTVPRLMGMAGAVLLFLAVFVASSTSVFAQNVPFSQDILEKDTQINYYSLTSFKDGEDTVLIFSGSVELIRQGSTLTGDNVVAWGRETPDPENPEGKRFTINFIYAEGSVRFVQGQSSVICKQLGFDVANNRAVFYDAEYFAKDVQRNLPMTIIAKKITQLDNDTFEAEDAYFTTCSFKEPHYSFSTASLKYNRKTNNITLYNALAKIEKIPFFWIPVMVVGVNDELILEHISFSRSDRFGNRFVADFGIPITVTEDAPPPEVTAADGAEPDGDPAEKKDEKAPELKKIGKVTFSYDYMSKRGLALAAGTDISFHDKSFSAESYYLIDKGPDDSVVFEQRFLPMEEAHRGKFRSHYRQMLTGSLRLDTELTYLSDRNFLYEFYENEYKSGRPQETYLYLRYSKDNIAATLLERARVNDFQSQTEYLPRVAFYADSLSLGKGLYFTHRSEVGNIRNSYDEALDIHSERVIRFDTLNYLDAPFSFLNLRFEPGIYGRYSYYSMQDGFVGDEFNEDRSAAGAWLRMFAQFSRVYETNNDTLGIEGLRHLVSLDMRYSDNFLCDPLSEFLPEFDSIEQTSEFKEISFELKNTLQTRRRAANTYLQFLELGLEWEYYPDGERDSASGEAQNYLFPMNWVHLMPAADGTYPVRDLSNVYAFLKFTPQRKFTLSASSVYNTFDDRFDVVYSTATFDPGSRFALSFTDYYYADYSHSFSPAVMLKLSDRWKAVVSGQYEFEADMFINKRISLHRDMHDYSFDIYFDYDEVKDVKTFWVTFSVSGFKSVFGGQDTPFLR